MSSFVLVEQLDCAINVLLSDSDAELSHIEPAMAEMLSIAAELRVYPRPQFRSQLRMHLVQTTSDRFAGSAFWESFHKKKTLPVLPSLLAQGYSTSTSRRTNFAVSLAAHLVMVAAVLATSIWMKTQVSQSGKQVTELIAPDVSAYQPVATITASSGGGGGGGDRDKLQAPEGRLPKLANRQITPPEVVIRNNNPKLTAEPTVVVPQVNLANNHLPNLGDPKSTVLGPPSNGIGSGAGIGSGNGGGIGSGNGLGVGPGLAGGYGGGIFYVGGGVSAPRVRYKPDPEYSPEARQAKYQGTVILSLIVEPDGQAHGIRVARSLGMGLDEKAIEAVRQWRFDPAMKDGKPVAVAVQVEVSFRLF